MADFTAHYIFADQVYSALSPLRREIVDCDPVAYNWGAQGPDLLFFRGALTGDSPLPGYGNVIHSEKPAPLFAHILELARKADNTVVAPMLMSYLFGFICHYALDRVVHPYVFHLEQQQQKTSDLPRNTLHAQIECDIDCDLYRHLYDRSVTEFDVFALYPLTTMMRCSISLFYKEILQNVYQIHAETSELEECFPAMINLTARLYDSTGFIMRSAGKVADLAARQKRKFSSHIKRDSSGWDSLNLRHRSWYNPWTPDDVKTASIPDLLQEAQTLAIQMIDALCDGLTDKKAAKALVDLCGDIPFANGEPAPEPPPVNDDAIVEEVFIDSPLSPTDAVADAAVRVEEARPDDKSDDVPPESLEPQS